MAGKLILCRHGQSDWNLKNLFTASPDAIIVSDGEGCISMANESVRDVYGYAPEELIGQHTAKPLNLPNHTLISWTGASGVVFLLVQIKVHVMPWDGLLVADSIRPRGGFQKRGAVQERVHLLLHFRL